MKTTVLLSLLLAAAAPMPSCLQGQNQRPVSSNNSVDSVDTEKLARYLTSNENEQKTIIDFLLNMETNFHISLHLLFQENDYLTVVYRKGWSDRYEYLTFYFTYQDPPLFEPDKKEAGIEWMRLNGYLSYSRRRHLGGIYLSSWYQTPSRSGHVWKTGQGLRKVDHSVLWHKIVDLNEFGWYLPKNKP